MKPEAYPAEMLSKYRKLTEPGSAPATTTQSLYLGTITATAPSLLPLVFLPALSGFFIFRVAGITLDALLVNQPDGPEPFKHTQRHPSLTEVRLMRMPYKQDFIAALLAAKEQGIGAILAFIMAYLRGRYNGGAMAKTLIDAVMCAMIAWFVRDLLDFIGLSSNLAYIASVFIGYIGTDSIGNLIKKFAARKAGVDDAGTQ